MLDEPTNDLDIDSLEMLEQTLATYPGTIILVSHDRRFLDNVVTEVLAPEGNGLWREYVGGYSDWLQQRPEPVEPAAPAAPQPKAAAKPRPRDNKIRMSYKETQELERLPKLIEDLEAEQAALMEAMSAPTTTRSPLRSFARTPNAPRRSRMKSLPVTSVGRRSRKSASSQRINNGRSASPHDCQRPINLRVIP